MRCSQLSDPKVTRRGAPLAIAALVALFLLPPMMATGAPSVEVSSPEDGGWTTDPDLVVTGTAVPDPLRLTLAGDDLEKGTGTGVQTGGGKVLMGVSRSFYDDFGGLTLDDDKWRVVRDQGNIDIAAGHLVLSQTQYQHQFPLLQSKGEPFPDDRDWTARFRMAFSGLGYSGTGGGVTPGAPEALVSHMAVYNLYTYYNEPRFRIYAEGEPVYNATQPDTVEHWYLLSYEQRTGTYTVAWDDTSLATFQSDNSPSSFWLGCTEYGLYVYYSQLSIDQVDVWSFSGRFVTDPFDLGDSAVFDSVDLGWTSTHRSSAVIDVDLRVSEDNQTWSRWVTVSDGVPETSLEGRYGQVRLNLSLPGVMVPTAKIEVDRITVGHHHPIASVEVRRAGGEWVQAEGLEDWTATIGLEEGENTLEVRVTDTVGSVSLTSLEQTLDTTPPAGTVRIMEDEPYTNDLNVTLELEASDLYGVDYVEVSNYPDMFQKTTFPYTENVRWKLVGTVGEVGVFVRFVDSHGLRSEIVTDTIVIDTDPPSGEIKIDGGAAYTPSLTVDLLLEYYDTIGVAMLEISNQPGFAYSQVVEVGTETYRNWTMEEGGDGPRTVYLRMTDRAGNARKVSDSIEYYAPKEVGSLTIDGGAELTREVFVDLGISVPLGERLRLMQISNDAAFLNSSWEALSDELRWRLSPGDGHKRVFLRFLDQRDIVSLPVHADITLDTTPPEVQVVIDSGAEYTTDAEVDVTLVYSDAHEGVEMWLSSTGRFNDVDPVTFSDSFTHTVLAAEGPHSLHVQVRDLAGNLGSGSSTIHYATRAPTFEVTLQGGQHSSSTVHVRVDIEYEDAYGGVEVQLAMGEDLTPAAPWYPADEPIWLTIPEGTPDGTYELASRARNAAGITTEGSPLNITLDRTPPVVTILSPLQGSVLSQEGLDFLLEYTADDSEALAGGMYRLDAGDWTELDELSGEATVEIDDFGIHTLELLVKDLAGNEASDSSTFEVVNKGSQVAGGGLAAGLIALAVVAVLAALLVILYWQHRGARGPSTSATTGGEVEPAAPAPPAPPAPSAPPAGAHQVYAHGVTYQQGSPQEGEPGAPEEPVVHIAGGSEWEEF